MASASGTDRDWPRRRDGEGWGGVAGRGDGAASHAPRRRPPMGPAEVDFEKRDVRTEPHGGEGAEEFEDKIER